MWFKDRGNNHVITANYHTIIKVKNNVEYIINMGLLTR